LEVAGLFPVDADKYWDLAIDGFGLQSEWLD